MPEGVGYKVTRSDAEFDYDDTSNYRRKREKPGFSSPGDWEPIPAAKGGGAIKQELGYKAGGGAAADDDAKYGKMTDEEISKLSPLMQASARARRKKWLSAQEQAKALKDKN